MRVALASALVLFAACGAKDTKDDYIRTSKQAEARVRLKSIIRAAEVAVADTGSLPVGSVGPTPAQPCCASADKKCPVDGAQWRDEVWERLHVYEDSPHYFQYSYKSDGKTFTASATGDVMCEGKPVTFTVSGSVVPGGLDVDTSQIDVTPK